MDLTGKLFAHKRFAAVAAARRNATAVEHDGHRISYTELDERANLLAHRFQDLGVGRGSVVMTHLERSIDLIVSLLATLKAGATYLPVEPGVPDDRLATYVKETGCAAVVTRSEHEDRFTGLSVPTLSAVAATVAGSPADPPGITVDASDTAYIVYTSGSSGTPKGVQVSHASLGYLCQSVNERYGIGPDDRVLQFAALSFDTSIEQILVPLVHGATLVLPEYNWAPSELAHRLASLGVTVMDLTPPYWRSFLAELAQSPAELPVRLTIVGGSAVHAADCDAALRLMPDSRLVNAYGLTETTITSCTMEITRESLPPQGPAPIGRPLPQTAVHVLDQDMKPVPPQQRGEIYIGGPGVAQGYLAEQTPAKDRFLDLPGSEGEPTRVYRTGDVGRWTAEGNLEVVGRADRQIKIHGFRVEPAEIEATLSAHHLIDDVAVTAFNAKGELQVAAYFTASGSPHRLEPVELRAFAAGRLPTFMIPAKFIQLDTMPMTTNGKIDLAALPDPSQEPTVVPRADTDVPTASMVERAVAGLWCQVLDVESVAPDDNFFNLGGNSILAAELLAKVRASLGILITQVRPLIRLLLEHATLRSFASAVESARAGTLYTDSASHVDLEADTAVGVPIQRQPTGSTSWADPSHVFLTGATGFLGIYLLRELLTTTSATVHCLVRAADADQARERIKDNALHYMKDGLESYWAEGRIAAVPGDLGKPQFGLADEEFDYFAQVIDVIHHPGGLVNFIYPYSHMRPANVEGTREIIRMAGRYRNIPVHYVSTMAVVSGFGTAGVRHVTEETPLAHADHLSVGYVESKWVAEALLQNAAAEGLPVAIYRAADISGDQATGAWNTATEMCAMKRFVVDTGTSPIAELPLDYTPVDCYAAALLHIASSRLPAGEVYHLTNPGKVNISLLAERLRAHGHTIREIPWEQWLERIVTTAVEQPDHPMTPFAPLFIDRCSSGTMSVAEMYLETTFPTFSQENVKAALRGSGIDIPPVDATMLDRYIEYLTSIDFL
ncbi:amino acid adenylation domain-containing protein [Streptomyces botrytidirepellens]|uniref:Amino acid adenylation domain-containing protein n=1 Tax=Streptomyces botrytidirepellens TaxID=2486417 RepID=A0A3M8SES8_9ACTN|nr:amino acid adenylation domain-containing protein [Streptomyces botrytidirepellens]RNF77654.1 amino acid adenylation domain-containing protein [Streptomyces botrytidirepellens]